MPMVNINGTDVEFSSWREVPVEEGVDIQRGVNGDLNATIIYDKREWDGAVPCFSRAELEALIALADFPEEVDVYGDLIGEIEADAIPCKVQVKQRSFTIAGLPSGFYCMADVLVMEA